MVVESVPPASRGPQYGTHNGAARRFRLGIHSGRFVEDQRPEFTSCRPRYANIIGETKQYIRDFDRIETTAQTGMELYEPMLAIYPDYVNPGVLWNSARAVKV
jgi:hypothetical protein